MEEQLAEIKRVTGGKFGRVFDASAWAHELSIKALETCSDESAKYFSSVDDWQVDRPLVALFSHGPTLILVTQKPCAIKLLPYSTSTPR